ncbi:MAG: hypothetical protein ABJF10_02615 [Chthoniobacter sp.]|uniref:CBM96 family carbohydrate-binding protein n=1 Tax=Chthoniobacter sp. TaxID=2510640 RepID=UPI0032A4954F
MPSLRILFLAVGAAALFTLRSEADSLSVSINPSQDAFVSATNSSVNYGKAGALSVSNGPQGEFDSLLQFDLSSVKSRFDLAFGVGGWTVQSITLQLTASTPNNVIFNSNNGHNIGGDFSLTWLQDDAWTEGAGTPKPPLVTTGLSYSTLPGLRTSGVDESLGTFTAPTSDTSSTVYTLALTGSFTSDVSGGNLVSLLALPVSSNVAYTTNSKDFTNGSASSFPQLTVTAQSVPEPAPASLLAGGILLGLLQRRRHARAT